MIGTMETTEAVGALQYGKSPFKRSGTMWLAAPLVGFFLIAYAIPVLLLLGIAFNPPDQSTVRLQPAFSLVNFAELISSPRFLASIGWSLALALGAAIIAGLAAIVPSYVIARSKEGTTGNLLLALVLLPLQVDVSVRIYGLIVLLGDEGLINQPLAEARLIQEPFPFIYNPLGDLIGMTEFGLPFMIVVLAAAIRQVDMSLEDAARTLGAGWARTVRTIVLPLAAPGLLAGSLLVFSVALGSYSVPVLLGNYQPTVATIHLYQAVASLGNWQFGAALATTLLIPSLAVVFAFYILFRRASGGDNA